MDTLNENNDILNVLRTVGLLKSFNLNEGRYLHYTGTKAHKRFLSVPETSSTLDEPVSLVCECDDDR